MPTIHVDSMEVGDLWLGDRKVAIVEDVFGGAEGVLGADGLGDKRIPSISGTIEISIRRSRGRVPRLGFTRVPVKMHARPLVDVRREARGRAHESDAGHGRSNDDRQQQPARGAGKEGATR